MCTCSCAIASVIPATGGCGVTVLSRATDAEVINIFTTALTIMEDATAYTNINIEDWEVEVEGTGGT